MRLKLALAALMAVGVVFLASALWSPVGAMGPVGPSAANKAENTLVEKVHRRWRRGYYAYYPRHRYRPYYYSYARPYYYAPYYRAYDYPYYGAYYGPRFYGYGFRRPRFGISIGF
jgi:hypothetical protein